jgi:hypothetical protein
MTRDYESEPIPKELEELVRQFSDGSLSVLALAILSYELGLAVGEGK